VVWESCMVPAIAHLLCRRSSRVRCDDFAMDASDVRRRWRAMSARRRLRHARTTLPPQAIGTAAESLLAVASICSMDQTFLVVPRRYYSSQFITCSIKWSLMSVALLARVPCSCPQCAALNELKLC
jgi:hypothetical protein